MYQLKKTIKIIFTLTCIGGLIFACKKSLGTKASRLRDTTKVNIGAQFQMIDSVLKVKPKESSTIIKNVRGSFMRTENTSVDLTKMSGGQITLATVKTIKVSATISTPTSKDMACQADKVPLSTTATSLEFVCEGDSTSTPPTNAKKYPPTVLDDNMKETYDLLSVQCLKTQGNALITNGVDKDLVYGCYCPKTDRQVMFDIFPDNVVDSFESLCNVEKNNAPLFAELRKACSDGNPIQQNATNSCVCLVNGLAYTMEFKEFAAIYKPADALRQSRKKDCGF